MVCSSSCSSAAEDQKAPLVITMIKPNKFIRNRELDTEEDKWITYYRKGLFRCIAKKKIAQLLGF